LVVTSRLGKKPGFFSWRVAF
jgi:hypothetical protein